MPLETPDQQKPANNPVDAPAPQASTEAVKDFQTLIKTKTDDAPATKTGGEVKYNTTGLFDDKVTAPKPAETLSEGPVDTAEQDADALHKMSGRESWYSFGNRSIFADKDGINNLLLTKTDAEREAIKSAYQKKYLQPLEEAMHFAGENDSDYQKFHSILNCKSSDLPGQASDRISMALTEEKQGPFHSRDQYVVEQDIRDTLRIHNNVQIEEIKAAYAKAHPGHTLQNDIANDARISKETKEAAAIYLQGSDKLSPDDKERVAHLALQKKDITMFGEAMQGMDQTERRVFMQKGGQVAIEKAFNKAESTGPQGERIPGESTADTLRAMDLADKGQVSAANEIRASIGLFSTDKKGIENAIDRMPEEERHQYIIGKALAGGSSIPPELNGDKLTAAQKEEDKQVYDTTHSAMAAAGNGSQVTKWENQIAKRNSSLASSLADHQGTFWNDGKADILKNIAGMKKEEFDDARAHPQAREEVRRQLENLEGARLGEADVDDIMKAYDQKISAKDYASSQHIGNGDVIANVINGMATIKIDRRAMLDAIANMSPEEQDRYRSDGAFKKQLDDQVAIGTSTATSDLQATGTTASGPAYDAARRMLDRITAGQKPNPDIVTKLAADASDVGTDRGQVIREVQQAFKDDPTLQDRLKNPQSEEDQKLSKDFDKLLHQCLSDHDYDSYANPLIQTGHLAIDQQLDLDKRTFANDKQAAFKDILNASPDEIKRMQTDSAYRDRVLNVLNDDQDKKVAINIVKQGEAKTEDRIRERINHWGGTSQIMDDLKKIKPEEVEALKKSYLEKYGSSLEGDLYGKLGSDDKKEAARILEQNIEGEQAYNISRDSHYKEISGFGASLITGLGGSSTVVQSQESLGDYTKAITEANKNQEILSASEGKELKEKLVKADDAVAKAKEGTADAVAEIGIAAGVLISTPVTGGLSLVGTAEAMGALGTVGAVGEVVAKGSIMDADYDWSMANVAVDAGSGFAESAVGGVGPGQAAKIFGFGGKIGAAAGAKADSVLVGNGAEELLKQGGKEDLITASKELLTNSLAEGTRVIEAHETQEIAEQVVAKSLTGEAREEAISKIASALQHNVQDALIAENKNVVQAAAERAVARGVSGFVAGTTGGAVEEPASGTAARVWGPI